MDNVPLVVLACGIRNDTGAAFQLARHRSDRDSASGDQGGDADRPPRREIYPTIRRAFQIARRAPAGPVAVEIPANFMMLTQNVGGTQLGAGPRARERDATAISSSAPHGCSGRRNNRRSTSAPERWVARHSLISLAEQLGAPVVTTFQGKGVFPESHPLWLWTGIGRATPPFVRTIMDRCDCLLAVGCRFGEVATGSYGDHPARDRDPRRYRSRGARPKRPDNPGGGGGCEGVSRRPDRSHRRPASVRRTSPGRLPTDTRR